MSTPSSVLVGCFDRTVWVKVDGRGTFQNSVGMKEFVKQMVQRGYREFVVDLDHCEMMDSTFMGTLAGVALRLREIGQGSLKAVNANERNTDLLSSLGLDQLFTVIPLGSGEQPQMPSAAKMRETGGEKIGVETQKEAVLEAHEALAEADSANATKFKDVLDYLRNELNVPSSENSSEN